MQATVATRVQPAATHAHTPSRVAPSTHAQSSATVSHKSKTHRVAPEMTREEELAAFERHSNKSGALTLLVSLLGVSLIGYGMYKKLQQSEVVVPPMIQTQTSTTPDTTGAIKVPQQTGDVTQTPVVKPAPTGDGADIVKQYILAIGKKDIASLAPLQDSSFRNLATLRTYFNAARLTTFANSLKAISIQDLTENTTDPALARNSTAKAYDFSIVYTLTSDNKEYRDQWRAYTIVKDSGTVINGFVYQGNNTAQSPFFQFSKFGIK